MEAPVTRTNNPNQDTRARMRGDRRRAMKRQRGLCWWCDRIMLRPHELALKDHPGLMVTMEHLRPRGNGGSDRSDNIVAACEDCNQKRGARTTGIWDYAVRLEFWADRWDSWERMAAE